MSLFFISLLMLLVVGVMGVLLALQLDHSKPRPTPLDLEGGENHSMTPLDLQASDEGSENNTVYPDHDTLMRQHGDRMDQRLREFMAAASSKKGEDGSSDEYRRFVGALDDLYREYERGTPYGRGGSGGMQSDAPGVIDATTTTTTTMMMMMQADEAGEREADQKADAESDGLSRKTDQVQSNINEQSGVSNEVKTALKELLNRGRALLEYYRGRLRNHQNLVSEASSSQLRVRELEDQRSRLDLENASLREQLKTSRHKASELQAAYEQTEQKLNDLNRSYEQKVAELKADEEKLRSMEAECAQRKQELDVVRGEKQDRAKQIDELMQTLDRKNKEHDHLHAEFEGKSSSMQQNMQQQEETCKRLRAELERAVAENRSDAAALRQQVSEAQAKLAETEAQHREETARCTQQLNDLKRDLAFTEAQLKESRAHDEEHQKREREMEQEVRRLKDLLASATKQFNAKVDNVEDASKLVEELKNQCSAFQRSMDDERSRLNDAENKVREYEQRLRATDSELNEARKRVDKQTELLKQEQGEFAAYRTRYNQDLMDEMEREWSQRTQRESKAKIECLQSLDDKEQDMMRLKNKLEARIHDLEYQNKRLRQSSGQSSD